MVRTIKLPILFHGGGEDSALPRKVHLLNPERGRAMCGQHIGNPERIDSDFINSDDYQGQAACQKCLKRKIEAINRFAIQAED
jgi:hypothetical protein